MRENRFTKPKTPNKNKIDKIGKKPHAAVYAVGITLFLTVYELIKDRVFPGLKLRRSNGIINQELLKEINKHKATERALKESERLLHESQKSAHIGSFLFNIKTKTWKGTAETNEIFGIDEAYPHTLGGLLEIVHPDSRRLFSETYNLDSGEHQEFDFEYQIINQKSGNLRWIHGYGCLQYNEMAESEILICTIQDITDRKQKEEENYYLSYHDQLTGLYNRRFYEEELKRLDTPRNLPITVIIGDVNGLKLLNDSFGHTAGDRLLIKAAEIIKNSCRSDDIVARIGGDEFIILLPGIGSAEAESIINRIKSSTESEKIENISISISFGYETKFDKDESIQDVIKKAEDYMYKKKLFVNQSLRGKTISSIIATLHKKNKREELHSNRVGLLCEKMGIALGLPEFEVMELKTVGMFHDIGKIAIDENILMKEGNLTEEEWREVMRHSEIGYRILSTANDMSEMADYVLSHHERWDGKGYPKGLREMEIPFVSRIIAIADSFDAMTSESCYQEIISTEEAVAVLQENSGTRFDPELVDVFIHQVLNL